jgi:Flp pilus assembly protein TadB
VAESKQDRELIELLNELRVALPGVQVMFAFLLAVPFSQGFAKVTSVQKASFFVALIGTAIATILLIAPSSFHRIQWREHDKERLLQISNGLTIAGLAFLAVSMTAVVFTVTDFIYGSPLSVVVSVLIALGFTVLWYVVPLIRKAKTND